MKIVRLMVLVFACVGSFSFGMEEEPKGKKLTLHNQLNRDIYARQYQHDGSKWTPIKSREALNIKAGLQVEIYYQYIPSLTGIWGSNSRLYFSFEKEVLKGDNPNELSDKQTDDNSSVFYKDFQGTNKDGWKEGNYYIVYHPKDGFRVTSGRSSKRTDYLFVNNELNQDYQLVWIDQSGKKIGRFFDLPAQAKNYLIRYLGPEGTGRVTNRNQLVFFPKGKEPEDLQDLSEKGARSIKKSFGQSKVQFTGKSIYTLREDTQRGGVKFESGGSLFYLKNKLHSQVHAALYQGFNQESNLGGLQQGQFKQVAFPQKANSLLVSLQNDLSERYQESFPQDKVSAKIDPGSYKVVAGPTNYAIQKCSDCIVKEALKKKVEGFNIEHFHNNLLQSRGIEQGEKPQLVRQRRGLSDAEARFIQQRIKQKIKPALAVLFAQEVENVPKIAIVGTGGGYRALTENTGFLLGAEKIKWGDYSFLDATLYITGLSGSTWQITSMIASGKDSVQGYASEVFKKMFGIFAKTGLEDMPSEQDRKLYDAVRVIKYEYDQDSAFVQRYGAQIASTLLKWDGSLASNEWNDAKNRQRFAMSDLRDYLNDGQWPLPICTAVAKNAFQSDINEWYEFSPFEVAKTPKKDQHVIGVPTEYFGSIFNEARLQYLAPEHPLAYLLGIFGSAFSVDPESLGLKVAEKAGDFVAEFAKSTFAKLAGKQGFYASSNPNFAYGMQVGKSIDNRDRIFLIDGGHAVIEKHRHNFGSTPILWRDVDIAIMCDSHRNKGGAPHLQASVDQAKRMGYTLIDEQELQEKIHSIGQSSFTVFDEAFKKGVGPIVIYMKGKQNDQYDQNFDPSKEPFTDTTNFDYSEQQFKTLSGLCSHIMIEAQGAIENAIRAVVYKKNSDLVQSEEDLKGLPISSSVIRAIKARLGEKRLAEERRRAAKEAQKEEAKKVIDDPQDDTSASPSDKNLQDDPPQQPQQKLDQDPSDPWYISIPKMIYEYTIDLFIVRPIKWAVSGLMGLFS